MKKQLTTMLLVLVLALVPSLGMAITEKEWNQECEDKTVGTVTIYSIEKNSEATTTDLPSIVPIGTLSGGTYVKIGSYDYDLKMWHITYFSNGTQASAWVKRGDTTSATKWVYFTDGCCMLLPEALVNDRSALQKYLDRLWPNLTIYGDGSKPVSIDGTVPSGGSTTSGNKKPSGEKKSAKAPKKINTAIITAEEKTVTLSRLGVLTSSIIRDGVTEEIATRELSFGGDVPAEQAIAVIHAPQSGKCTLRERASDEAKAIQKSKAGTVVSVLEYGRKYCKINDNGTVGYVQTSCLKFYGGEVESLGVGTLTYKGKATGKTTINVRGDAKKGSARITEWKTGTEVIVFDLRDGWYEIEHDGVHGYVMDDFLTMKE